MQKLVLILIIILFSVHNAVSALPAPWTFVDIGSPGVAGSGDFDTASATFSLSGSGLNIGSQFGYIYETTSGDFVFTARVASLNCGNISKTGILLKEGLTAGAKYVSIYVDEAFGIRSDYLDTTSGTAVTNTIISALRAKKAPMWLRLERISNTYNVYFSIDSTLWTLGKTYNFSMNSSANIGMATASRNNTSSCKATFDNIPVSISNVTPTSTIDVPVYKENIVSPTFVGKSVTLNATATDTDGSITKVDFMEGSNIIGTANAPAPFTFVWNNPPSGTHTIFARATDNSGGTGDSSTTSVIVTGSSRNVSSGANFTLYWDYDSSIDIDDFVIHSISGTTVATDGTAVKTARSYTTSTTTSKQYYICARKSSVESAGSTHIIINVQ